MMLFFMEYYLVPTFWFCRQTQESGTRVLLSGCDYVGLGPKTQTCSESKPQSYNATHCSSTVQFSRDFIQ